ncbi:MAG: twin-arginine translocase TatA/TatE family subunit [Planctomycetota bacterium]
MVSPNELLHLMVFGLGPTELIVILCIIFLLFGAKRIPQLARGLGKGITEFKKGLKDVGQDNTDDDLMDEIPEDTDKKPKK